MKINKDLSIYHDEEAGLSFLFSPGTEVTLERVEAIKLRNYLNSYLNGELEAEENDQSV